MQYPSLKIIISFTRQLMEVEHPEDVRAYMRHPNEQGHKLLATNIVKHLQQGILNEYTNKN